jgi:serine/threonine protein kinase/tetratricopeptide (TPR) repeat protein
MLPALDTDGLLGAEVAGRYRLLRQLGDGPLGASYEAQSGEVPSLAVKIVRRALLSDEALSRYLQAAASLSATRNVHLVVPRDVAYDLPRGLVVFARDLLVGPDLATFLARNGPLAPSIAVRIVAQACDGIASVHGVDLAHRSIKPANVFLEPAASSGVTVRVCDPGVGSAPRARGGEWEHLRYGAPEVASLPKEGARESDRRADVYSLGALLYTLLSGAPPYAEATSAGALLDSFASREVDPVQTRAPWVPAPIARVVDRALSRDPARRFSSAQTLGAALRELTGGEDSVAREDLVPLDVATRRTNAEPTSDRGGRPAIVAADASPQVERDPLLGHRLGGRYRVLDTLGRGGMGTVYTVEGPGGERFAAKVISREAAGRDTLTIARFIREAHAVTKIDDPHVTRTIELGTDLTLGVPFLVMELLEGRDLGSLFKERGAIEPAPLLRVFAQAATGLSAAHAQGIVHRDIKPANVFLDVAPDGSVTVKICDFGLAKAVAQVDDDAVSHGLTRTGGVLGTPMYMSPEHVSNPRAIDERADVWSLCASLYEGLSGRRLWASAGASMAELMLAIAARPITPLREVAPWVSPAIAEIVERGLARAPEDRWQDFEAMRAALAIHTGGAMDVSIEALASVDAARLATRPAAAPRAHGANASLLTAAGPAAGGAFAAQARTADARARTGSDLPSPQSPRRFVGLAVATAIVALVGGGALYARSRARAAQDKAADVSATRKPVTRDEPPVSKVPGATEAFRRGIDANRDAQRYIAIRAFDEATKLDPDFAAAHLRRAMIWFPMHDTEQGHLREAIRLRGSLGPHDRTLVDAFAPLVQEPQDVVQVGKLLANATATAPDDPDFALQLCRVEQNLGEYAKAREDCARAKELDPGAAAPLWLSGVVATRLEDASGAVASFQACLVASPLATSCLMPLTQLLAFQGQCDDALALGRRLLASDPSNPGYYQSLASLLAGAGQPIESVRRALDEQLARTPPADVPLTKLENASLLAIQTGDFAGADQNLRAWGEISAKSLDEADHLTLTQLRAALAEEKGDKEAACGLARQYLGQRAAWTPLPDDDATIFFEGMLYRNGALSRAAFVARRDAWTARKRQQPKGNSLGSTLGFAWVAAYATPALTGYDAREALDVLKDYLPLPDPSMWLPNLEQAIGHVYLLAGREREAIPFLTRAAKSCLPLAEAPFEQVVASLQLGQAQEATGDTAAACEAYRAVSAHWSTAISRSARLARSRALALHCGP